MHPITCLSLIRLQKSDGRTLKTTIHKKMQVEKKCLMRVYPAVKKERWKKKDEKGIKKNYYIKEQKTLNDNIFIVVKKDDIE